MFHVPGFIDALKNSILASGFCISLAILAKKICEHWRPRGNQLKVNFNFSQN